MFRLEIQINTKSIFNDRINFGFLDIFYGFMMLYKMLRIFLQLDFILDS